MSQTSGRRGGELAAAANVELAVDAVEVSLGGLGGDERRLRDLTVGEALGSEPRHPELAGGECITAGDRVASGLAPAAISFARALAAMCSAPQ